MPSTDNHFDKSLHTQHYNTTSSEAMEYLGASPVGLRVSHQPVEGALMPKALAGPSGTRSGTLCSSQSANTSCWHLMNREQQSLHCNQLR